MRNLIKFLSVISAVVCTLIFILIYFAQTTIPERVTIIEKTGYNMPKIFGFDLLDINSETNLDVLRNNNEIIEQDAKVELFNIIPVKNIKVTNSKRKYVVPGGEVFGIKLYTDGIIIVDTDVVETESGNINPAEKSGLVIGDIIKKINGEEITSTKHLSKILEKSQGNEMVITLIRNSKEINVKFRTYKDNLSGKYKAGLWVRDSTAGLGTVTFYNTENNSFAGLGHPIYDVDTNKIMPMKNGEMAEATINGLYKSSSGSVGELCGLLSGKIIGELCLNCEEGIYGFTNTKKTETLPVAVKQEIVVGDAQIICTVDNSGPQYFDVEIVKIYSNSTAVNKDMIIKIKDEKLLNITGGIVQGMSGTPIIQNGMLVGAITHVFVNEPTQGYAIFAERMYETSVSRDMQKYQQLKAS
ncbi:MAG: SpoIVB peptidase [Clostridia bacterium]|nr:SpoIVB peptidase [Clostridia bacterium]